VCLQILLMRREELERVRAWAAAKIAAAEDSQSSSAHFIKLREALDSILSEMEASTKVQKKSYRFVAAARRL
jgi:hypothetical protein